MLAIGCLLLVVGYDAVLGTRFWVLGAGLQTVGYSFLVIRGSLFVVCCRKSNHGLLAVGW